MADTATVRVELGNTALNKDWYFDVDTSGTSDTPTWTPVNGITDFKATTDVDTTDDTDFSSDGWTSEMAVSKSWSIQVKLKRARQASAVAYDPGQDFLLANNAGVVHVRWYEMGGDGTASGPDSMPRIEAYEGHAAVKWADDGGDNKALRTATVDLTGRGKRLSIAHPAPNATTTP
jgi:hypothetical protein